MKSERSPLFPILTVFPNYVKLWGQLEVQYHLTPGWRIIRRHRLLNRMHKLTKEYNNWFNDYLEANK